MRPFPQAAPFEVLVACILSIRTRDKTTLRCARRLFVLARTPTRMAQLRPAELDAAIADSTFREAKAWQIPDIARQLAAAHGDRLPYDGTLMLSFYGVGPKCANLVLGMACAHWRG